MVSSKEGVTQGPLSFGPSPTSTAQGTEWEKVKKALSYLVRLCREGSPSTYHAGKQGTTFWDKLTPGRGSLYLHPSSWGETWASKVGWCVTGATDLPLLPSRTAITRDTFGGKAYVMRGPSPICSASTRFTVDVGRFLSWWSSDPLSVVT